VCCGDLLAFGFLVLCSLDSLEKISRADNAYDYRLITVRYFGFGPGYFPQTKWSAWSDVGGAIKVAEEPNDARWLVYQALQEGCVCRCTDVFIWPD
jgi:hypothetical protein